MSEQEAKPSGCDQIDHRSGRCHNDDCTWCSDVVARAAVERAVQHADQLAQAEDWEVGGGFWSDEASDHLYDEREWLGAETYALAKELLKEAERERKGRRR